MIAHHAVVHVRLHDVADLVRVRPVPDHVSEANDPLHVRLGDTLKDRLGGGEVSV